MQAQIHIVNSGKRIVTASARFGHKPNQVVSVKLPPKDGATQTLSFNTSDAQDSAKFQALAKLLTDASGPLGHALKGKKAVLAVTVEGGSPAATFAPVLAKPEPKAAPSAVSAPDAKQGANKGRG